MAKMMKKMEKMEGSKKDMAFDKKMMGKKKMPAAMMKKMMAAKKGMK